MWFLCLVGTFILIKIYNVLSTAKCYSNTIMSGKVAIVTGSSRGIGFETALELARRGAKVILGSRNHKRGQCAVDEIIKITKNKSVKYIHLDLSSLNSVRQFVDDFRREEVKLDVLINNAGVIAKGNDKTEDGILRDMQINHFGPFLLTSLLVPLLKKSAPSRVIVISSNLHRYGTIERLNEPSNYLQGFCNSKLCNVLFSNELARRLADTGVVVNSLHPGHVNTSFYRSTAIERLRCLVLYAFFRSPVEGAQTSIHLAVSEDCDQVTGRYFAECKESTMAGKANDERLAAKLWSLSEAMVKLRPDETV